MPMKNFKPEQIVTPLAGGPPLASVFPKIDIIVMTLIPPRQFGALDLHLPRGSGCPIPSLSEGVGGFDFLFGSSGVPDFNPQNQPRSRHRAVVDRRRNYSSASLWGGRPGRV